MQKTVGIRIPYEEILALYKDKGCILQSKKDNRHVIDDSKADLGQIKTVEITIDTSNHLPIKLRLNQTPLHKHKLVQEAVGDMLEEGIMERFTSSWRTLNKIINPLAYPLPLIDDIFLSMGKSNNFSTLDLGSGYW